MAELFIKHNKNAVPIDTAFGRGPNKDLPLTTVGHVIAACATEPSRGLLGLPANTPLTLHLPERVARSSSGLSEDCFVTVDESDTTLDPGCPLLSLGSCGTKSKQPLLIKAETGK